MDIALLRVFLGVAEESSLTEAAKKLNTVQSNISARLKVLEEELGQPLFLRSKKGMVLTEFGERLRPMAADVVQRMADIKSELRKESSIGDVTLGVPESFLRTYLRKPLANWVHDHPQAKVILKTGYSHQISAELENRTIDFGVIISRQVPKHFHVLREFKSEVVLVTPPTIQEVNRKTLSSLQPMLLGDASFFGQVLTHFCAEHGIESPALKNLHSIEAILHCVSSGIGYSVMPKCLMDRHSLRSHILSHPIRGKSRFSYFKVCLASRATSPLTREIAKYL